MTCMWSAKEIRKPCFPNSIGLYDTTTTTTSTKNNYYYIIFIIIIIIII